MKRIISVGAAGLALASLCFLAAAQGILPHDLPPASPTPSLGNRPSNIVVIPFAEGNPRFPALAQTGKPESNIRVFPLGALQPPRVLPMIPPGAYRPGASNLFLIPSAPRTVPPGVYKTEPYSCIVVVPGAHLDDRCIINPGVGDIPMPIVKPDLRFIPWNAAK